MADRSEIEETLRTRLSFKRQEHQDLGQALDALMDKSPVDQLQLQRFKKKKLVLKDQIKALEAQLFPDIIA